MYIVGRIAVESVNVDARLRAVLAALNGRTDRDALLEASPPWTTTLTNLKARLNVMPYSAKSREAILKAISDADAAWNERNRYVHDLLVESIAADDELHPEATASPRREDRLRVRLARDKKRSAPDAQIVSLDQAVELTLQLVAVGWRLRAAQGHLAGTTTWNGLLFGYVTGNWDGSAEWVSDNDDDD
ncbi:hypothetical protein [Plantibacter sp. M259]|uniref:hypothetical protein n=1 Tax=Plantibacter sp. M259 TaxID=2583822 RepID=UPI0011102AAD|nr:hypothetical protein [Plantibacter sp. M259]